MSRVIVTRRALMLGLASGLIYGSWAYFANHTADPAAALRAAGVQFALSFGATAILTMAMDAVLTTGDAPAGLTRRLAAAVLPITLLALVFAAAHAIAGTPRILATIAPSYGIGLVFCAVYVRSRGRAGAIPAAVEPCSPAPGRQV
ncbi:hypothetical protein GCM10011505_08550 [Tistrella bauzanensis]|uniref:Uncharacterized protein n=1 Tax=Tistrella bauzanensis TaxID=657419 RepID=A0ABQ1I9C8_9PROT|nr:hypothetical protein [Tistrella bauzanensis]GGB29505.1 hypothetical protein GCM10011505_08550 [Tistrella bauzanensis]